MVFGILTDDSYAVHHVFSGSGQLTQAVSLGECTIGGVIKTGFAMKTGTMTAVVANIERLVPPRCRRQLLLRRTRIGHVVAGR